MPPRKSTLTSEVRIRSGVLIARQLHGISAPIGGSAGFGDIGAAAADGAPKMPAAATPPAAAAPFRKGSLGGPDRWWACCAGWS